MELLEKVVPSLQLVDPIISKKKIDKNNKNSINPSEGLLQSLLLAERFPCKNVHQTSSNVDLLCFLASNYKTDLNKQTVNFAQLTNGAPITSNTLKKKERCERKIQDKYNGDASAITDVARNMIVYNTIEELYLAIPKIEQTFNLAGYKDNYLNEKKSGYRAIYLIINIGDDNNPFYAEIQLQLADMREAQNIDTPYYNIIREIKSQAMGNENSNTIFEQLQSSRRKFFNSKFKTHEKSFQSIQFNTGRSIQSQVNNALSH